jgi:CRP-like cAMP-binding protein
VPSKFYVVLTGSVDRHSQSVVDKTHKEGELGAREATYLAGDMIGGPELIALQPQTHTLVAGLNCKMLYLDADDYRTRVYPFEDGFLQGIRSALRATELCHSLKLTEKEIDELVRGIRHGRPAIVTR